LARANAYDALEDLVRRGVVLASAGRPRQYRAAGGPELCSSLTVEFSAALGDLGLPSALLARGAVEQLDVSLGGTTLVTTEDELVRASVEALNEASSEVLAVVGPWAMGIFDGLARALDRGVSVRVAALGMPAPEGAVLRRVPQDSLVEYWGGYPVSLVADRRRAICAVGRGAAWSGVDSTEPGLVPFVRHLLRREIAGAGGLQMLSSEGPSDLPGA